MQPAPRARSSILVLSCRTHTVLGLRQSSSTCDHTSTTSALLRRSLPPPPPVDDLTHTHTLTLALNTHAHKYITLFTHKPPADCRPVKPGLPPLFTRIQPKFWLIVNLDLAVPCTTDCDACGDG